MPRTPQDNRKCQRFRATHALLLCSAALAVALPIEGGLAQDVGELRGTLTEDDAGTAAPQPQETPPEKPDLPEAEEATQAEQPLDKETPDHPDTAGNDEETGTDAMPTGTVAPASAFPPSIVPTQAVVPAEDDLAEDFPVDEEPAPVLLPVPQQSIADVDAREIGTRASRQRAADAGASAVDEARAGIVPVSPVQPVADQPVDPVALREPAIESLNRPPDENPYEAVGVRWGAFVLKPSLDTGITATSNADSSVNGSSALLSETTLRLNAVSDWSSHRAALDAFGTFRKTLSGQEVEDVEGGVAAELLLDLGNDYRARGTFSYLAEPESAASPVVIANAVEEPLTQRFGGTLGLEKDAGKARFAITGGVSHDSFGDADLEGGGVLSQRDRDATLYSVALRAGYEISPALTPFVETEIGRNAYDEKVDSAGYRRSSDRWAVRAGLAFDRGEKFSGEIAAGVMREEFDDERLDALSAPSLRGTVLWSPLRGTNVRLTGSTILEGTTTPGESGSVLYASALSIERQMRANLTGSLTLGAAWRDYSGQDGEDTILNAEASLTWWLNRYAGLTGRLRHETVSSTLPDRDTETSSVFIGLSLQR